MDRLQKLLYLLMAVLGIYIFYKGGGLLLEQGRSAGLFDSGNVQRTLEDAALRTYVPGYTAVVEEREQPGWISRLMKPVLPVYSYLAEEAADNEAEREAVSDQSEQVSGTEVHSQSEPASGTEMHSQSEPASGAEVHSQSEPASGTEVHSQKEKTEETEMHRQRGQGSQQETEYSIPVHSGAVVSEAVREQLRDFDYLISNYYIVDGGTSADAQLLDADTLLGMDLRLESSDSDQSEEVDGVSANGQNPQILIYHTHAQEAFIDSEEGNVSHTVVGMGAVLKEELEQYGYRVLHDTGVYDLVDGVLDRSAAYDYARESVQQILEEYPSIEVIIDLHRDGVEGKKFVTEIDGKPTSMIMFFNGISRDQNAEPLYWLENPYLAQNLAFSLQLQLKAQEQYPGFTRNIYLKAQRFNLHLRPKSLLVEAGTQLNTVEEERNAMAPLADLIHQVLAGI